MTWSLDNLRQPPMPVRFHGGLSGHRNSRLPPLADRSSQAYKIALLSSSKLEREAGCREPDLRRCLGHVMVHTDSMKRVHTDMRRRIQSFTLEDDDSSDEDEICEEIIQTPVSNTTSNNRVGILLIKDGVKITHEPTKSNNSITSSPKIRKSSTLQDTPRIHPALRRKDIPKPQILVKSRQYLQKVVSRRKLPFWSHQSPNMASVGVAG